MKFPEVVPFLRANHQGVISTQKPSGAMHSSVVVCGPYKGNAAFVSVYPKSQKVKNLRRNSDCTVLAVAKDWHSYAVIEGKAALFDYSNTEENNMRIMLREVYAACSDTPHPNWEEYDEAMVSQEAVVVLVHPNKVYGMLPKEGF